MFGQRNAPSTYTLRLLAIASLGMCGGAAATECVAASDHSPEPCIEYSANLPARVNLRIVCNLRELSSWLTAPRATAIKSAVLLSQNEYDPPIAVTVAAAPVVREDTVEVRNGPDPGTERGRRDAAPPQDLGLDGYCPVTLKEQAVWKEGDERIATNYLGVTYRFAGQDEKKEFDAKPALYAPVARGADLVVLLDQGVKVRGARRHGLWYGDRVYLFESEESLRRFVRNPKWYATTGDTAEIVADAEETGDNRRDLREKFEYAEKGTLFPGGLEYSEDSLLKLK